MKRFWFAVRATLTCLISPPRFTSLAAQYKISAIQPTENEDLRRAQIIRRAFWVSSFLTAGALCAGYALGWTLKYFLCAASDTSVTLVQAVSAAVVLVATLAARGWDIQSYSGETLPEKVNQWLTRSLFVLGTFFFSLFLGWAP
jgi:hypothetical protein